MVVDVAVVVVVVVVAVEDQNNTSKLTFRLLCVTAKGDVRSQ